LARIITNCIWVNGDAAVDGFKGLKQELETALPDLQSQAQNASTRHQELKHREFLAWLSSTNFPAQQSDLLNRRQ
jgi:hypothetical protein